MQPYVVFLLLCAIAQNTGFMSIGTTRHGLSLRKPITCKSTNCNPGNNIPIRRGTVTLKRDFNITVEENMGIESNSTIDWYREEEWKFH
jgi:hypothetical protein